MVGDDGIGLPERGHWPVPGKIGALIVQALHENTKADVVVKTERDRGVRVTLKFGGKGLADQLRERDVLCSRYEGDAVSLPFWQAAPLFVR